MYQALRYICVARRLHGKQVTVKSADAAHAPAVVQNLKEEVAAHKGESEPEWIHHLALKVLGSFSHLTNKLQSLISQVQDNALEAQANHQRFNSLAITITITILWRSVVACQHNSLCRSSGAFLWQVYTRHCL
jgi:hypothetical protein